MSTNVNQKYANPNLHASFATDGKNLNAPSGEIVGTYGYVPAGTTSSDIHAVAAWVSANGGGTVHLQATIYTGSTGTSSDDINCALYPGVSFVGVKPAFTSSGNVAISSEVYLSGTQLSGFGFYGNNIPLGTPIANFGSNAIQGIRIVDMLIANCARRALDFGATNSMGLNLCEIDVILMDCGPTDYAASFVNFANCDKLNVKSLCSLTFFTGGGVQFRADVNGASVFIPGNSIINAFTQSYYRLNIGMVLGAGNNAYLNSLKGNLQANKYAASGQTPFTQTATFAASSSSIAVTNCEELPVGMPVWFTATNGTIGVYYANSAYFVLTRSAASGAGTVTIGASPIAAAFAAGSGAAGLTLSMVSGGWPCLNVTADTSTAYVENNSFSKLDLESLGAPLAVLMHASASEFNFTAMEPTTSVPSIIQRSCNELKIKNIAPNVLIDFDAGSAATCVFEGVYKTPALMGDNVGAGVINGHFVGQRGNSVVVNANAGTGATVTNTAGTYSNKGQITLITGSASTAAGVLATLTYSVTKEHGCPTLTPVNAAANALTGSAKIRVQTTERGTGFDLYSDAVPAVSATYVFNWQDA